MMRSDNLKKHKNICKVPEKHGDIVGDITNNVVEARFTAPVDMKKRSPVKSNSSPIQINTEQTDSEDVDSEDELESESESENMDIHREVDYPAKLRKSFWGLYKKLNDNTTNLHILLSELKRTNCLTSVDCEAICNYFKEKIDDL